ncbi:MAG: hypothetical protein ACREBC_26860 [Pyrinomonadaceae bacterium]
MEYERLLHNLEPVQLTQGQVLYEASDTMRHAYFLSGGMVSLLSSNEDGETVEVEMLGHKRRWPAERLTAQSDNLLGERRDRG